MSDLDDILRDSLGRLAEPGDTAGVADAVAAKAAALGGGGATSGFGAWVVPAVIGLVALGGGVTLGVGSASTGGGSAAPYEPLTIAGGDGIPAAACPGGSGVATLDGGARVLAIARTEDGSYLAVRDPQALTHTVWVAAGSATADPGTDVSALPVRDCEEASAAPSPSVTPSAQPTHKPTHKPTPKPTKTSKPTKTPNPKPTSTPKPVDKKPALSVGGWSPGTIVGDADNNDGSCTHDKWATIKVTATDDHSGVSVTASADFYPQGVSLVSHSGSSWIFKYEAIYNSGAPKDVTVTFTAKDSAGHKVSKSAHVAVTSAGSECVF